MISPPGSRCLLFSGITGPFPWIHRSIFIFIMGWKSDTASAETDSCFWPARLLYPMKRKPSASFFRRYPIWRYAACRKAAGNIFILIQSIFWNPHRTVVRIPGRFFICFRRFPWLWRQPPFLCFTTIYPVFSGNSRKKNRFISRLSMGCCFPFFQKSTALPCRLQTRSCRNPGTAILISAARSVICMHIIMSHFPSAALRSTAASAKAICAGCLKIWWGSVLWSICSITASSRPATWFI